ncbi:TonB-dependent receptor domain-containing protein [Saccharicrinis fermentans]|uniref:Catecholate siderophore receptor Fiu n=1 Tax=Saccharicrinis fermentans DSM 9555 = JCM 21142 TaxID=869213 RepID=W7YH64_9BACT|nr:TonB-dependent receptor [Saccharicrinis fermentans]GAF03751.1 catecholate siderophore receptor Fiu [Saccharicrinis fermentans DSM 9555 = JCM 21142]
MEQLIASDKQLYAQGDFPKGYNREQRYNDPADFLDHENYNLSARYIHNFSPTSKLKFQADYAHDIIDYFSTEYLPFLTSDDPIYDTYYLSGNSRKYICLDSLQREFPLRFSHHTNTYQNYLDYSFQVNTGSVEHKILAGYYLINIDRTTYKGYNVGEDVNGDGLFANIAYENPILNQGDLQTKFSAASIYNELLNSFYAQDLLNISNKLKGLVGIRADIYHMTYQSASVDESTHTYDHSAKTKQNEFALTYRAGLVYQPIDDLSLYSSYASYFRPNRTSYNPNYIYVDRDGNTFKPEDGEPFFEPESGYQLEGGLKYNYNSKLQLNASVFYIQKNDIVESLGKTEDGTNGIIF